MKEKFEPRASPIKKRIKTLKTLRKNGISTFTFIGPILPLITDRENKLEELILKVKPFSDRIFIDRLNLKPTLWEVLESFLKENFPELVNEWKKILLRKSNYYKKLKNELRGKFKDVELTFCY